MKSPSRISRRKRPRSPAQSLQAREVIKAWNLKRPHVGKCGAKARSTGEPCRDVPMANGRCYRHGGRVPKGGGWHKPVWPNSERPDAEARLQRKLRDLERRTKKRARRVAAMSDEERAAHERWQAAHRPGSAAARARARTERAEAQATRRSLAAVDQLQPLSAEMAEIAAYRDHLLAQLEALNAVPSLADQIDLSTSDLWHPCRPSPMSADLPSPTERVFVPNKWTRCVTSRGGSLLFLLNHLTEPILVSRYVFITGSICDI